MRSKSENIELWMGRISLIFFFIIALSFLGNSPLVNSRTKKVSIEQISDVSNSAILLEPIALRPFDNSLFSIDSYELKMLDTFLRNQVKTSQINQQIKREKLKHLRFKPTLLQVQLTHLTTLSKEDFILI